MFEVPSQRLLTTNINYQPPRTHRTDQVPSQCQLHLAKLKRLSSLGTSSQSEASLVSRESLSTNERRVSESSEE